MKTSSEAGTEAGPRKPIDQNSGDTPCSTTEPTRALPSGRVATAGNFKA
jgi:hypothetical protein